MRKSTRSELYKLRELLSFFAEQRVCCFCQLPLLGKTFSKHGNSAGPKLVDRITIHHHDGNHDNNVSSNKDACHEACHRRWHRREKQQARLVEEVLGIDRRGFVMGSRAT